MRRYVLVLVLTSDLGAVYLLRRQAPPFAGLLNGFGGKIEAGESPDQAAWRELREETGLQSGDLLRLENLLTLSFPQETELHVYSGILAPGSTPDFGLTEEGTIERQAITSQLLSAANPELAGDGNLAYFLQYIRQRSAAR